MERCLAAAASIAVHRAGVAANLETRLAGLQRKVHASFDEHYRFGRVYEWGVFDLGPCRPARTHVLARDDAVFADRVRFHGHSIHLGGAYALALMGRCSRARSRAWRAETYEELTRRL